MKILQAVVILLLAAWFIITTVAVLEMPPLEYKFHSWAIVACGPIVVVAGLWEICSRVFKR